jgi:hypothetical protein
MVVRTLVLTALFSSLLWGTSQAATVTARLGEADKAGDRGLDIEVSAAPGEVNVMRLFNETGFVVVHDDGAPVTAGSGCQQAGPADARCAVPPQRLTVSAFLGDGDDQATLQRGLRASIGGGDGNDRLDAGTGVPGIFSGGAGDDTLLGSLTDDTLRGDAGKDVIHGGRGDDTIEGDGEGDAPAQDDLDGGPGEDELVYGDRAAAVTVDLGATTAGSAGENDAAIGFESAFGGAGDDTLIGTAGENRLSGGKGADVITAGAGDDIVEAGTGDDRVSTGDGDDSVASEGGLDAIDAGADDDRVELSGAGRAGTAPRRLACGPGLDTVIGSFRRPLAVYLGSDCERLDHISVTPSTAAVSSRGVVSLALRCPHPDARCRFDLEVTRLVFTAGRQVERLLGAAEPVTTKPRASTKLRFRLPRAEARLIAAGKPVVLSFRAQRTSIRLKPSNQPQPRVAQAWVAELRRPGATR